MNLEALLRPLAEWGTGVGGSLHWIVLLPLAAGAMNGWLGKRPGPANVPLVPCGVVLGAFLISSLPLARFSYVDPPLVDVWWDWFTLGDVDVQMAFPLNRLSAVLIC